MKARSLFFCIPLLISPFFALAQEQEEQKFTVDTPVTLDFDRSTPKKRKNPRRKFFMGLRPRKVLPAKVLASVSRTSSSTI
jgi:hypothetical protein